MVSYLLVFLISLAVGLVLVFPTIYVARRLKLGQTTLHYVKKHSQKSGTPTMGGVIFIFATILSSIWFFKGDNQVAIIALLVGLAYGFLGFMDDFIKVKLHQNEGLKPYQKIIGQLGIAIILAIFVYMKIGTSLKFFSLSLDIGFLIIPFVIFIFLATTNSVNLTDGLDGLAGGVSLVYLLSFGAILVISGEFNLAIVCFALVGGLLAFLSVNVFPAKIFMGDTGSLALGGFISAVAVFSKQELLLPIIGLMFVLTAISDIIQVIHFKRTKKRIFLMAPLHHHFEQLGVHENRIVIIYIVVTAVLGALSITLQLVT